MKFFLTFLLVASTLFASELNCSIEQTFYPEVKSFQCGCSTYIWAEVLYWYGKENKLPLAMVAEKKLWGQTLGGDTASGFSPQSDIYMKGSWDPGFRVGLGCRLPCSEFSISTCYTYYRNKHTQTAKVPPSDKFLIDLIPNGVTAGAKMTHPTG